MGKSGRRNLVIIAGKGDLCPRCKQPTQIREHIKTTEVELRKPFYYSRWFYCQNTSCKTTLIMPDRFKVLPKAPEASVEKAEEVATQTNLTPPWEE